MTTSKMTDEVAAVKHVVQNICRTNGIEIDREPKTVKADSGVWVQAWVYVSAADIRAQQITTVTPHE